MSGPGDCLIRVNADWAPEPTFDTTWTAVHCVDEPVVNVIAMFPPWADPEPLTVRSGAIAAFHTSSVALVALPDSVRAGPPVPWTILETSISYHRASTPRPPPNSAR